MCAAFPPRFEHILIEIADENITLNVPDGTTAEWNGKAIPGLKLVNDKL